MFRKECYDELRGYNNRIRYAQDYHLFSRWVQKFKTGNISTTLVKWRQSKSGISTTCNSSQRVFADNICVSYVRSVFPELSDISDEDIKSMRNGRYNKDNIVNITRIIDSARIKFNCEYAQSWYESFMLRTRFLRG